MGQNSQEYWATCSSFRSFACTAHSFACSALLAPSAALTPSLAPSLARSWGSERFNDYFICVSFCSGPQCRLGRAGGLVAAPAGSGSGSLLLASRRYSAQTRRLSRLRRFVFCLLFIRLSNPGNGAETATKERRRFILARLSESPEMAAGSRRRRGRN